MKKLAFFAILLLIGCNENCNRSSSIAACSRACHDGGGRMTRYDDSTGACTCEFP